jgi:hypothetical protein
MWRLRILQSSIVWLPVLNSSALRKFDWFCQGLEIQIIAKRLPIQSSYPTSFREQMKKGGQG